MGTAAFPALGRTPEAGDKAGPTTALEPGHSCGNTSSETSEGPRQHDDHHHHHHHRCGAREHTVCLHAARGKGQGQVLSQEEDGTCSEVFPLRRGHSPRVSYSHI